MRNEGLLSDLSIPHGSFEGYLAPGVYKFSRPTNAQNMLAQIVGESRKIVTDEMINRTIDLGFSFHQILTLASVIELETTIASERPILSSVIHNRYRIGMPLQLEEPLRYGLKKFGAPLNADDKRTANPYNTFLETGLPASPISNVTPEAIQAALYPADTDYLYFTKLKDGSHQFSSTLREHTMKLNQLRSNSLIDTPEPVAVEIP
jgi:UPF0755 protein